MKTSTIHTNPMGDVLNVTSATGLNELLDRTNNHTRRNNMHQQEITDAERYRWLREHFRFANDSMRELWFDQALEPDDAGVPVDLDQQIDAAMNGANA